MTAPYLSLVPGGLERPLVEVCVDIPVVASQSRVEHLIGVVKGVHQRDGLAPHHGQEGVEVLSGQTQLPCGQVAILDGGRAAC